MCGTVFSHQSCPVETDHHGQVQYRHVVYDIVVCPLCESTVYIAERLQPVLCHSSGECHGVTLGDSHVEGSLRHLLHHDVQRASRRHRRRHSHDALVLSGEFEKRVSEHVLELCRFGAVLRLYALPCVEVEFARSMPDGGGLFSRCVSVSFYGVQMQQLRSFHLFQLAQRAHELHHVVSVEGSEIPYVHPLEDVLLMAYRRLQRIAQPYDAFASLVIEHTIGVQPFGSLISQFVVSLAGVEPQQILLHSAHAAVDAHIIVVEDDYHVVWRRRHVVESLESQSAAHRSIADYRHHVSVVVARLPGSHRHSERRRYGV